ncbi:unnamed protein product [Brassica rapa]|uniref:NAC domain-containing protein n=1 Tax=Brassica campestris TaxID=3711 RepID=A0A3P6ALB5_BRACM|nr:unnamed protein product [Brassica rapa]VDC85001.1 unnamed protein product [Brassica rapa]
MTDQVLPAASEAVLPIATGRLFTPGFRFRPTDEELISYYLKMKVQGKPMFLDAIGEVDVYKHDPSDLPEHSRLMKTKHQEWFFFTTPPEKHGKRENNKGYWIQKGEDKKIKRGDNQLIGMVKRLLFNRGCAPNGQRTYWVIREYRLVDDGHGLKTDAYVLCRVSHNQSSRPPRGNINAPFSEQECGRDDDDEKKIQQESNSGSKILFDLNELPREFDDNNDACIPHSALNKEPFIHYRRKRQTKSSLAAEMLEESEPEPVDSTMMVPTSSYTELKQQMAMERERYKLETNALRTEIEELKKKNSNKWQCS